MCKMADCCARSGGRTDVNTNLADCSICSSDTSSTIDLRVFQVTRFMLNQKAF